MPRATAERGEESGYLSVAVTVQVLQDRVAVHVTEQVKTVLPLELLLLTHTQTHTHTHTHNDMQCKKQAE